MINPEGLINNQETGVGLTAIKERMRAMLSGGKLEEVSQKVEAAIDGGVDTILQTIAWLKENYRTLFIVISPILLAACAIFTDKQPVSAADIQKSLDQQRAGAATQEMSADQLADLQATPVATPIPTRKPVTPTRIPGLPGPANLSRGADATEATATPANVLAPTVEPTATPIELEPRDVTVISITKAGINVREDHSTTAKIAFTTEDNGISLEATGKEFDDGNYIWYQMKNPDFGIVADAPEFIWVAGLPGVDKKTVTVQGGTGGLVEDSNETVVTDAELDEASAALNAEVTSIETQATVKKALDAKGIILGTKVGNGPWTPTFFPKPAQENMAEMENATIETVARMIEPFELAGSRPIGLAEGVSPEQASLLVNEAYVGLILKHNPNLTLSELAKIIQEDGTVQINVIAEEPKEKTGRAPSIVGKPQVITIRPKLGISYQRFADQGDLLTNIMNSGITVEGQLAITGEIPPESLRLTFNGEIVGAFIVVSSTDARVYTYADQDGQLIIGVAKIGKNSNTAYLWGALIRNTYPEAYIDQPTGGGGFSENLRDAGLGKNYNESTEAFNRVGTQDVQLPSYLQRENWLKTNPEKTTYTWALLDQSQP